MKLRNKKTGEIFDIGKVLTCDYPSYETLKQINEDWEDYEPTKPLIEDEEIREIIRAWADVNDTMVLKYNYDENSLVDIYRNEITFNMGLGLKDGEKYTITELCGEEEE
jgi:hypothetical protein